MKSDIVQVAEAALEYIDALPEDLQLPVMPGFDRDWANDVIETAGQVDAQSLVARIAKQSERISELLRFNNEFEERARVAERQNKVLREAAATPEPQGVREAFERIIRCYEANVGRQSEKLEDIPMLARRGLAALTGDSAGTKSAALKAGDILTYEMNEETRVGEIIKRTRPSEPTAHAVAWLRAAPVGDTVAFNICDEDDDGAFPVYTRPDDGAVREALEVCAGALQAVARKLRGREDHAVRFTEEHSKYGSLTIKEILDRAEEALTAQQAAEGGAK